MNPLVVEEKLGEFIFWTKTEPDLPKKLDQILLLRYLKASEFDLDRAKNLLKNSLKWRQKRPDIFTQRDPLSKEMRNVIAIA